MNFTSILMHLKRQETQERINRQERINKYDGAILENDRILEILQQYSDMK